MRLKSEIWVKAYLRRCQVGGAFAAVRRHGDNDAGAIFIKIARSGSEAALFAPAPAGLDDLDLGRRFVAHAKGEFLPDADVETRLARETSFDHDLWIVEVEDREGRNFLDDELLS